MILDKLIGPVTGLLGKFIEDKDQANALAHEITTLNHCSLLAGARLSVGFAELACYIMCS